MLPFLRTSGGRALFTLGRALALAILASACASNQGLSPQVFGDGPLEFHECPAELAAAELGECALARVPLNWEEAERSEQITLFVRRFRSSANTSSGDQLWALDGGPGFAGEIFADPAFREVVLSAGYDLYIPTHRGTVFGTGLACAEQQVPESAGGGQVTPDEFPACVASLRSRWGEGLRHFDSLSAAHDVRHMMERSRPDIGGRVVLYGGSYGTYWAQRVLQVAPVGIAGVWLDSIVDLEATFERADENSHAAGMRLLRACAEVEPCGVRFADGVDATVDRVLAEYAANDGCGQGSRPQAAVQALFNRLLSNHPSEQALVAPLLVRADRCSEADKIAIDHALSHLLEGEPGAAATPGQRALAYNPLLNKHIMLTELFRYDRRYEDVVEESKRHLFAAGADLPMASIAPTYGREHRLSLPPGPTATDAHLVLWQGGLDPLDRPEWAATTAQRWAAGTVTLIELPMAGHSVVRYTTTSDGRRCATEMLHAFLDDPSALLDESCLDGIPAFDFSATSAQTAEAAIRWFGVPEPWGDEGRGDDSGENGQ